MIIIKTVSLPQGRFRYTDEAGAELASGRNATCFAAARALVSRGSDPDMPCRVLSVTGKRVFMADHRLSVLAGLSVSETSRSAPKIIKWVPNPMFAEASR